MPTKPMIDAMLSRKAEYEILPMNGEDCHAAALLHGTRFFHAWGDGEIFSLLRQTGTFGFVAKRLSSRLSKPQLAGFVLARAVAGEGEILTIAVAEKLGRAGLGWRLMQAAQRQAVNLGAESLFLEVEETNIAAIGLYRKLSFVEVGKRPAYYSDAAGRKTAALVMRRELR